MGSQRAKVVLSLDAEAVGSLREGVNFKKNPENDKYYIIYKGENGFRACKNQCKHQGGMFIKDIEDLDSRWECSDRGATDKMQCTTLLCKLRLLSQHTDLPFPPNRIVKCTKHNWKLNISTMQYVNPPDSFTQEELGKNWFSFCCILQWMVLGWNFSWEDFGWGLFVFTDALPKVDNLVQDVCYLGPDGNWILVFICRRLVIALGDSRCLSLLSQQITD